MTVVLDANLTESLIEEGYVRELISKIQTQRKEADFEVTDRIAIAIQTTDKLADIATRFAEDIKAATLGLSLTLGEGEEGAVARDWNVNGEAATISLKVL